MSQRNKKASKSQSPRRPEIPKPPIPPTPPGDVLFAQLRQRWPDVGFSISAQSEPLHAPSFGQIVKVFFTRRPPPTRNLVMVRFYAPRGVAISEPEVSEVVRSHVHSSARYSIVRDVL